MNLSLFLYAFIKKGADRVDQFFEVGKIVNTQGLKGEVRVISFTDSAEERYQTGKQLTLFQKGKDPIVLTIKSHRKHKNFDLLSFIDHDRIEDVIIYKEGILKVAEKDLHELDDEEFYYHEIIGLTVFTEEGENLGTIKDILPLGSNDVWVVKQKGKKDLLLPYIKDVVKEVNLDEGLVRITLLEGMLDE